jgi:hypothetical protein
VDLVKDPVVYRVYYTSESQFKLLTACEMRAGELLEQVVNALDDGFTRKTTITEEIEEDRKLLLNVVAYLRRGEGGMLEHVVYTPTEIYLPSPRASAGGFFVISMVAGLLCLSFGIAYAFYRKYKRVQRRLEYELTDVRNIAGASSESFNNESLSSFRDNTKYSVVASRQ